MSYKRIRVIPRLDVKGSNLVKGIHLEGLRILGKPEDFALRYSEEGADEIIYIDSVASLYGRDNLLKIVEKTAENIFIPLTAGGGVRTIDDIRNLLRAGAEKVAINTAALKNPDLIRQAAERFGSQCVVVSIEAQRKDNGNYEAYVDNGREATGIDVFKWAKRAEKLGAGEILITSIDREGTGNGYDTELVSEMADSVSVPVIACGGAGRKEDILEVIIKSKVDAISAASIFHYNKTENKKIRGRISPLDIIELKSFLNNNNIDCREERIFKPEINRRDNDISIGIIDYGLSNLFSIKKIIRHFGVKAVIVDTASKIMAVDGLILPGVGAFKDGMEGLRKKGLMEAIRRFVYQGKPLFGICLGMQLLMSQGEEFGRHQGLGLIEGKVIRLKESNSKIPHIGWSKIKKLKNSWERTPLENIKEDFDFYFAHSYMVVPEDSSNVLAVTECGDNVFCSMVSRNNIFGCQFHPEKSGKGGLKYYENIINIVRENKHAKVNNTRAS